MWWFYRKVPSDFSGASTAEEITAGVDGRGLVAFITDSQPILALRGVRVVMAVRNVSAGFKAREAIQAETPGARVDVLELDLSSMDSVRRFASEFDALNLSLSILIFMENQPSGITFVASIFSGALGSFNSSFNSMDGLRHFSSLDQARGYTPSPLGTVRPKCLHPEANPCTQVVPCCKPPIVSPSSFEEATVQRYVLNLAPYLGAALGAAIIYIPLATKFSLMFDV